MHQRSRSASDNGQMSVRCQGSRIPWTNSITRRHRPTIPQDQKLPPKIVVPKNQNGLQKYIGFVNYYRNYILRLSEKLAPFHELVKADKPIKITNEILATFENINKALDNACGLWLKQPLPNKQYVLMTDANFKNAGYALMIEENADEKLTSVKKTYAPVAFGSKPSRHLKSRCQYMPKNSWPYILPSWNTAISCEDRPNRSSS